jgi:UDP-N-acetylmuramate dehydrogenase
MGFEKIEEICRAAGATVRRGQKMSNHTALGVGGEIDCIAYPETREQAAQLVAGFDKESIPWSALGAGYNLLARDEPIHRVAISLKLLEELLIFDGAKARMHGGYRINRLVAAAADRGLTGLEGLAALPGTVGAAIRADDGAHKYRIASVVESVSISQDGRVVDLNRDEIDFADCKLILGCVMRLQEADAATVRNCIAKYLKAGNKDKPGIRSAGPLFRVVISGRRAAFSCPRHK